MGIRGRNRKKPREKKEHKYVKVPCPDCGRELNMKKGKKPKCPYCRGASWALKKTHKVEHITNRDIMTPSGVL